MAQLSQALYTFSDGSIQVIKFKSCSHERFTDQRSENKGSGFGGFQKEVEPCLMYREQFSYILVKVMHRPKQTNEKTIYVTTESKYKDILKSRFYYRQKSKFVPQANKQKTYFTVLGLRTGDCVKQSLL